MAASADTCNLIRAQTGLKDPLYRDRTPGKAPWLQTLHFIYSITRKHHLVPNPEIKMYQKVIYCMDLVLKLWFPEPGMDLLPRNGTSLCP